MGKSWLIVIARLIIIIIYCNSWNTLGEMSPQHVGVTNHHGCTGWVISCRNKLYDMSQLHIASCLLENFCGNLCLSNIILSLQQVAQILCNLISSNLLQWQNSVAETKIIFVSATQPVHGRCFIFLFVLRSFRKHTMCETRCRAVNKSPRVFVFYHVRSTDFEEKIEGLWTG